ncbi:hypothetical protein QYE76_003774 [Lolium multiflorum]|uniref:Retrotransposon gag domain-containing protein n=1 Tax=Lolium multiflorum TaxID=4521 RepID=A0AAD8RRA1_LOLMU|nr:hypothetical protein QYE76_003774 [Lolium multiflorum]
MSASQNTSPSHTSPTAPPPPTDQRFGSGVDTGHRRRDAGKRDGSIGQGPALLSPPRRARTRRRRCPLTVATPPAVRSCAVSAGGMKRRQASHEEERSMDVKMDVKLDKELDMKISHGRAREEREECARGEEEVQADIITWREYEDLRNEMRREFRTQDDELKSTVDKIKQTLDATNVTVTGLADQMTDIQRNIADMRLAIENLTAQQQQQDDDEDPELEDDAHNARGAPRGHRPRGWVPLGRNGRGQDEEDGLGKPKFSIPKFEGGADVEEYLTWELKIEKLWSLHPNYSEDKKIELASSEFDGYALRWWDSLVRNLDEDGAQPIRTWRAMKEAMTSRFVPTNYMRNIFDKLTLLRQGVKTVDEYYMEMEMLMQRGRVRESLEMTMQRFLNGLKYDVKGIVRHYTYTNMNQLLHHAREAESQLAEEAKEFGDVFPEEVPAGLPPLRAPSLDGELLLFMGAAALMKMAVEMAAVSMEKPSGTSPWCRNETLSPYLGFTMAAAREGFAPWLLPRLCGPSLRGIGASRSPSRSRLYGVDQSLPAGGFRRQHSGTAGGTIFNNHLAIHIEMAEETPVTYEELWRAQKEA